MTHTAQLRAVAIPKSPSVRTMVLAGLALLAVLMSLYIYFVGKIVFDVVARKGAEIAIRNTSSEVSSMQSDYFSQIRSMDLAEADSFGLAKSTNVQYAVRDTSSSRTVGLLTH